MVLLPILPHMPSLIKEKIIKKLDYDEKTRLRRCSKDFKAIVSKSRTSFEGFFVSSTQYGFKLNITEGLIEYEIKFERDPFETQTCWTTFQKIEPGLSDEDGVRHLVISHIVTHLLENAEPMVELLAVVGYLFQDVSRITIEKFGFDYSSKHVPTRLVNFYERFGVVFSNMKGGMLSVQHLELTHHVYQWEISEILPYLKPGLLQRFTIKGAFDFESNELRQLQQWQEAVCIDARAGPFTLDYDKLPNFKFVAMSWVSLSLEDIQRLIRKVEERGEEFELLHITGWVDQIRDYIEDNFQSLRNEPQYRYKRHPTLDFSIRFRFGPNSIFLEMRRVSSTTLQPTDSRFLDIS